MTFAGSPTGVSIPDNNRAGVSSTANVTDVTSGAIAIDVNISHTWIGDLTVTVEHEGRTWVLHSRDDGSDDSGLMAGGR